MSSNVTKLVDGEIEKTLDNWKVSERKNRREREADKRLRVEIKEKRTEVTDDSWEENEEDQGLSSENCVKDQNERLLDLKRRVDRLTHLRTPVPDKEKYCLEGKKDHDSKDFSVPEAGDLPGKSLTCMTTFLKAAKLNAEQDDKIKLNQVDQLLNNFDFSSPYIPTSQKEEIRKMMSVTDSKNNDPPLSSPNPLLLPSSSAPLKMDTNINNANSGVQSDQDNQLPPPLSSSSSSSLVATTGCVATALNSTVTPSISPSSSSFLNKESSKISLLPSFDYSHDTNPSAESLEGNERTALTLSSPISSSLDSRNLTVAPIHSDSHLKSGQETPLFHSMLPSKVHLALEEKVLPPIKTNGVPLQKSDSLDFQKGNTKCRKERPRIEYSSRKSPFHSPNFSPPLLSPSLLSPPLSPHYARPNFQDSSQSETVQSTLPPAERGSDHAFCTDSRSLLHDKSRGSAWGELSRSRSLCTDSDSEVSGGNVSGVLINACAFQKHKERSLFQTHGQLLSRSCSDSSSLAAVLSTEEALSKLKHEGSLSEVVSHPSDWANSNRTIKEVARLEADLETIGAQSDFGLPMGTSSRNESPRKSDHSGQRSGGEGEEPMCSNTFGSSSSSQSSPGLKAESKFHGTGTRKSRTRDVKMDNSKQGEHENECVDGNHSEDSDVNARDDESSDEVLNEMLDTVVHDMFKAFSK